MNKFFKQISQNLHVWILLILLPLASSAEPLFRTLDLDLGEKIEVELIDGSRHVIQALDTRVKKDDLTGAVRETLVLVSINKSRIWLVSGSYQLPVALNGIQIDCPVTNSLLQTTDRNAWSLEKDIRLRVWPANSNWITPGTFCYPLDHKLFASYTQMTNMPVALGTVPGKEQIYYHSGLDFGGCEGIHKVYSATNGYIVSVGENVPAELPPPVQPRYDVVYVRDSRGWYYRYSHLKEIDNRLKRGDSIRMGQEIGLMGKEGASGGWTHLHFAISSIMPSGKWGNQSAYPFIWEAYQQKYKPDVIAVARPDIIARVGEEVRLDGSRSWSREKGIVSFEWELSNGEKVLKPAVTITYNQPGFYSEILKVSDNQGNTDYDFAMVQVYGNESQVLPFMHAAHYPNQNIQSGEEITFMVRTLRTDAIEEIWDFGDGSEQRKTKSLSADNHNPKGYAVVKHRYSQPGDYIVTIQAESETGITGTARLFVKVNP